MTLQSAIDQALPELRRAAEARMKSRATVRRQTGAMTQDEETGREVPEWAVVHADLPVRYVGRSSKRIEVGGVEFQEATGRADFPHDTTDLHDGDLVEVTAGEWAGTVLKIVEAAKGDQRTARRVPVVEVARPEEWA